MTIEEVFGILPVSQDEVEIERTNDWGNITNPNWGGKMKEFSLGLQNSKETILSNMIAKKTNNNNEIGSLGIFLDFMQSSQQQMFDLIYRIIERILNKK